MFELMLSKTGPVGLIPGEINGVYKLMGNLVSPMEETYTSGAAYERVGNCVYLALQYKYYNGWRESTKFVKIDLNTLASTELAGRGCYSYSGNLVYDGADSLYHVGGLSGDRRNGFNIVYLQKYSIKNNTWEVIREYGASRQGARAFYYNNKIYLLGGTSEYGGVYGDINIFDLATKETTTIQVPELQNYTYGQGKGVVVGDKFYFGRGGYGDGQGLLMVLDLKTNTIESSNTPAQTSFLTLCLVNGKLVTRDGSTAMLSYDLATKKWVRRNSLPNKSIDSNSDMLLVEYKGALFYAYLNNAPTSPLSLYKIK